jgi:AraC family transcriptional regulator, regulatory protein of adaptative response / DNA-3-methyladenine glycosylase II
MTPDSCNAVWHEAVNTRDRSFDGVFYVAITSTRIYCRPVCPSRLARPENRRFFASPAAAEAAGFRACLRCRPGLASAAALLDAGRDEGAAASPQDQGNADSRRSAVTSE